MAERQDLMLRKSRRRDARAVDYGSYWIIEPHRNLLYAGGQFGMSLDEVEEWLTAEAREVPESNVGPEFWKDAYLAALAGHRWEDAWDLMPSALVVQTAGVQDGPTQFLTAAEVHNALRIIEGVPQDTSFECGSSGTHTVGDLRTLFCRAFGTAMPKL